MSTKIIGIAGRSGSGKTSVIREIRKEFSEKEVCILSLDNYYKPRTEQVKDDKGYYNFDLISSFEWDRVLDDLKTLISGNELRITQYIYNQEHEAPELVFQPAKVIIIEGIFVLAEPHIWDMLDYSIIIDADVDLCRERRLKRDLKERNYNQEEILHRFDNHVLPSFQEHIEPLKVKVDALLINEGALSKVKDEVYEVVKGFL